MCVPVTVKPCDLLHCHPPYSPKSRTLLILCPGCSVTEASQQGARLRSMWPHHLVTSCLGHTNIMKPWLFDFSPEGFRASGASQHLLKYVPWSLGLDSASNLNIRSQCGKRPGQFTQ